MYYFDIIHNTKYENRSFSAGSDLCIFDLEIQGQRQNSQMGTPSNLEVHCPT